MSISSRASSLWEGRSGWRASRGRPEPEQHRQADRAPGRERQLDEQPDDDPLVAPARAPARARRRGAVVMEEAPGDLAPSSTLVWHDVLVHANGPDGQITLALTSG
jgi:hypothetical protein